MSSGDSTFKYVCAWVYFVYVMSFRACFIYIISYLFNVQDYKNQLHLDVLDRYLRRVGDKTILDEAPPSLESFIPPWDFMSRSPINTNNGVF